MRHSKKAPEIHAGSMADIAFLLLIFFLTTTTIPNDKGIVRALPKPCPPGTACDEEINERNVLRISLNGNGALLVNQEIISVSDLKEKLKDFIDNNGDNSCEYCYGIGLKNASDNPNKAAISLATHREAPYERFIAVQDEVTAAYYELRAAFVQKTYAKNTAELSPIELKTARDAYPFRITEASIE